MTPPRRLPDWVLSPLTVHPGMPPPVTDPDQARRLPELAVLSAPSQVDGPHAEPGVTSVTAALGVLSRDTGALDHDYLLSRFPDAARKLLEETIQIAGYEWQSGTKSHIAHGRARPRRSCSSWRSAA